MPEAGAEAGVLAPVPRHGDATLLAELDAVATAPAVVLAYVRGEDGPPRLPEDDVTRPVVAAARPRREHGRTIQEQGEEVGGGADTVHRHVLPVCAATTPNPLPARSLLRRPATVPGRTAGPRARQLRPRPTSHGSWGRPTRTALSAWSATPAPGPFARQRR